jgi:hypothetical protein
MLAARVNEIADGIYRNKPLLFHTGSCRLFPAACEGVRRITPLTQLRTSDSLTANKTKTGHLISFWQRQILPNHYVEL